MAQSTLETTKKARRKVTEATLGAMVLITRVHGLQICSKDMVLISGSMDANTTANGSTT